MRGQGFFLTPMKLGVVKMTSLSEMKLPEGTCRWNLANVCYR